MKGPVGNRSIKMPELAARIGSEAFVILVCNVFVVFLPAPRFEGAGRTVPLRALAFTLCLRHLRISGRRRPFVILIWFIGLGLAVCATIIVNIQFFCFHDQLLRERPFPSQQDRLRLIVASRRLSNSFLPTTLGEDGYAQSPEAHDEKEGAGFKMGNSAARPRVMPV